MNSFNRLLDWLLFHISVPKCVCCKNILEYGDKALCKECLKRYLNDIDRQCSRCNKLLRFCTCSNFYLERHKVKRVVKIYRYNSKIQELPGNCLIYALKQDYRSDVFDFLADELSDTIRNNLDFSDGLENYIITNVPRRKTAIQEYGYDHAAELAKRVAKILGIEYRSILLSKTMKAQKEVVGDERKRNAKFIVQNKIKSLTGIRVLLIDDIITTGSSIAACADALRALKPKEIIAVSLSIAYKDSYVKPKFTFN